MIFRRDKKGGRPRVDNETKIWEAKKKIEFWAGKKHEANYWIKHWTKKLEELKHG